ncbi:MAG: hypothetical protein JXK51_06645 [Halothiobacillaceae bacterium]|nr:hypothetical protein [Halothiobacillaceae bacterium]
METPAQSSRQKTDWAGWLTIALAILFFFSAAIWGYDPNQIVFTGVVWFFMAAFLITGILVAVAVAMRLLSRLR